MSAPPLKTPRRRKAQRKNPDELFVKIGCVARILVVVEYRVNFEGVAQHSTLHDALGRGAWDVRWESSGAGVLCVRCENTV